MDLPGNVGIRPGKFRITTALKAQVLKGVRAREVGIYTNSQKSAALVYLLCKVTISRTSQNLLPDMDLGSRESSESSPLAHTRGVIPKSAKDRNMSASSASPTRGGVLVLLPSSSTWGVATRRGVSPHGELRSVQGHPYAETGALRPKEGEGGRERVENRLFCPRSSGRESRRLSQHDISPKKGNMCVIAGTVFVSCVRDFGEKRAPCERVPFRVVTPCVCVFY